MRLELVAGGWGRGWQKARVSRSESRMTARARSATYSLVVKAAVAAEDLADDGTPGGNMPDLALAVKRVEVVEDVEAERDKALEDACPARLPVGPRVLVHAQEVVDER